MLLKGLASGSTPGVSVSLGEGEGRAKVAVLAARTYAASDGAKRLPPCPPRRGVPLGLEQEGAGRNDHLLLKGTLRSIAIERPKPTLERPQALCLGEAHNSATSASSSASTSWRDKSAPAGRDHRQDPRVTGWRARRDFVEATHSRLNRNRGILIRWSTKTKTTPTRERPDHIHESPRRTTRRPRGTSEARGA